MITADEVGRFPGKLPREVGGTETSLVEQYDLIEALAHRDGSLGWNHTFMGSSAGIVAARLPDDGVAEVREPDGRWPRFCGTFPMTGIATPAPGGFRLDGRWGFASGIRAASWVACGATRSDDATPVWLVVPVTEVTVHDTWDSPGLARTQSCEYTIHDRFVPTSRTFAISGAPLRGGPLFSMPIQAYLTPDHTGVTIGCARRALEECARHSAGKQRLGSAQALDARGAFVRDLGRAHTQLASAIAHVRDVLARMDHADLVDPSLFLDARCAATNAAEIAVSVATFAYRNGGAHAVTATSEIGRAYRDAMTSSQHVHVLDDVYEWRGAELLR